MLRCHCLRCHVNFDSCLNLGPREAWGPKRCSSCRSKDWRVEVDCVEEPSHLDLLKDCVMCEGAYEIWVRELDKRRKRLVYPLG